MSLVTIILCRRLESVACQRRFVRRGAHKIARTINPVEPSSCPRPRQVQRLVSADPATPCPHRRGPPPGYQPVRVVPVRICRRRDLERTCAPKFCDCPQRTAPRSAKDYLCMAMVFGVKGVVAAAVVYWTVAEGFWGKPELTERMYCSIRETIADDSYTGEVSLPRLEYIKFKIVDTYNHAVLAVMGVLVGVPLKISRQIRDALYPCEPPDDDKKKKKK